MNLKSNKYFFEIQDYLMILLGTLLYGFGFNGFILSNEIITGGLSGICALIYFASGQLIPVSGCCFENPGAEILVENDLRRILAVGFSVAV